MSSMIEWMNTAHTANSRYWLRWQLLVCGFLVLLSVVYALILIWKYERSCCRRRGEEGNSERLCDSLFYVDEFWKPCLEFIHPIFLLVFRVVAFSLAVVLLRRFLHVFGERQLYQYTAWTFILLIIYFGLGSVASAYGCFYSITCHGSCFAKPAKFGRDLVQIRIMPSRNTVESRHDINQAREVQQEAGIWGCVFQTLFLSVLDLHFANLIFLVDGILNSMRFQWFCIAYFILWTSIFVVFQWVLHACIDIKWPYAFLDLSSNWAPLWYLLICFAHPLCYALLGLFLKAKDVLFLRFFPQSYHRRM